MDIQTQKFLVMGMSKSGIAAAKLLIKYHGKVGIYDDLMGKSILVEENMMNVVKMGGNILIAEEVRNAYKDYDILLLSPGVPIDHPVAVQFKKAGKKIIGEMELGYRFLTARSIAVTGTNGKTTTVGMLESIFKRQSDSSKVVTCGNTGTPLCEVVEDLSRRDMAIVEVSSFQLESLSSVNSHICIELCVTQDHLNRHYTMDNYLFLKKKLLQNSMESEYVVLNHDDEYVRGFAQNLRAKIEWFSVKEKVDGAYISDGALYYHDERIMEIEELSLQGTHNISNALACIVAASIYGIPKEQIAKGLREFKGIRHRIEKIAMIDGITYINDSKATNVDATIKAVDCMQNATILLLGGKDKGYDYTALFKYLKNAEHIVHVVIYGENRFQLLDAAVAEKYHDFSVCLNLQTAFYLAKLIAQKGHNILLSPASASFDEFSGYEERGEKFTELVKGAKTDEKAVVISEE